MTPTKNLFRRNSLQVNRLQQSFRRRKIPPWICFLGGEMHSHPENSDSPRSHGERGEIRGIVGEKVGLQPAQPAAAPFSRFSL
jgi:hypothetical protein